jgi:hypothetical protein
MGLNGGPFLVVVVVSQLSCPMACVDQGHSWNALVYHLLP